MGINNWLLISKYEIEPRDIVLANPEYPDQSESKVRPLIVISNTVFHQNSGFFVCVGITTNKERDPYLLPLSRKSIEEGQLEYDVQVMCKRIVSLNCMVIKRKIARITEDAYGEITEKIKGDVLKI